MDIPDSKQFHMEALENLRSQMRSSQDRMSRDDQISAFLQRNGYQLADAEPLAQDASFRRYLRLTRGPRPAILMDAPPPEDIRPFVRGAFIFPDEAPRQSFTGFPRKVGADLPVCPDAGQAGRSAPTAGRTAPYLVCHGRYRHVNHYNRTEPRFSS